MTVIKRVARIITGINHVIIECSRIRHRELLVGVIDQDNQTAEIVIVHQSIGAYTPHRTIAVAQHLVTLSHLLTVGQPFGYRCQSRFIVCRAARRVAGDAVTGHQAVAVEAGIGIKACRILQDGITVNRGGKMEEFVTMQGDSQRGSVRLGYLNGGAVGRNCLHCKAEQSQDE